MKTSEMQTVPPCANSAAKLFTQSGGLSSGFVGMLPVRSSVFAGSHGRVPELVLQAGHDSPSLLCDTQVTHRLWAGQESCGDPHCVL